MQKKTAQALNEVNEGANITVETVTEEHSFLGIFKWTTTKYKLTTAESDFDWSQNEYTMGLYDVINSEEVVFNVSFKEGDSGWPITLDEGGGGRADSYQGGSDISISQNLRDTGRNRVNEPFGVVLMHEFVGHGHPAGGSRAHDINDFYQNKLGYSRTSKPRLGHPGYHKIIGWGKTGLYTPPKK